MILRLTLKTAGLIGEPPAEWHLLEAPVRCGEASPATGAPFEPRPVTRPSALPS